MADDNSDQYDLEMVENPAYSSDEDEFNMSTTDSEYGEEILHEQTITPKAVTAKSSAANNDFYMKSMRRQNICFGSSVFLLAGMFIAAYFYSDISFTPANAGIFGDETAMKGVSGEVGLDADNAETQEIIDEEIIERGTIELGQQPFNLFPLSLHTTNPPPSTRWSQWQTTTQISTILKWWRILPTHPTRTNSI